MREGAYLRGAYAWNHTSVKEKGGHFCVGLYCRRAYTLRNIFTYY